MSAATGPAATADPLPAKRTRASGPKCKRVVFEVPKKTPFPVRALWESATAEQQERAHKVGMWLLEYWVGRKTKGEVAEAIGVAPVRVWQMSQQAISGFLAGLLKQPRNRGRPPEMFGPTGETAAELRKRLDKAERELQKANRLIELLKEMPRLRKPPAKTEPVDADRKPATSVKKPQEQATRQHRARHPGAPEQAGPRTAE